LPQRHVERAGTHQSLKDKSGANAFTIQGTAVIASQAVDGGLLDHARAAAGFLDADAQRLTALSPPCDRRRIGGAEIAASWCACGADRADPASHLENRVGEPAAIPISTWRAGRERSRRDQRGRSPAHPPTLLETRTRQRRCPRSLEERWRPCATTRSFRAGFGDFFVDYTFKLKQWPRYRSTPSERWEQREYFSTF